MEIKILATNVVNTTKGFKIIEITDIIGANY